jgi:hypothetical protein
MIDLNDPGLDDEFIEEAHEFEVDLNCTVVLNHRLTLDGIDHSEEEGFLKVRDMFAGRDNEALSSEMRHVTHFHDDLRRVANNLAVVGLVTRLQHWIIKLVRQLHDESKLPKPKKPKSRKPVSKKPELAIKLELLNERLGEGPVPIKFFCDLENVRDSVIHGDSKAEWKDRNGTRRVEKRYTNPYDHVEFDAEQLKEAIANAIQQVKWYDERLSMGTPKD